MDTLKARLDEAMKLRQITRPQLADACNISAAAVSKWFTGNTQDMKASHVFAVARLCGCDAEWLATGHGPAPGQERRRRAGHSSLTAEFAPRHIDLLRMYKALPEEIRMPIRQMIETLSAARRERFVSWSKLLPEDSSADG